MKLFINVFDPKEFDRTLQISMKSFKNNQCIKNFFHCFFLIKVMDEIGTEHIDTLILSLPDKLFIQESIPIEIIMPLWSVVQEHITNQKIKSSGLADFNAKHLQQFFDALEDKNVK